jgi:hypothetical protein
MNTVLAQGYPGAVRSPSSATGGSSTPAATARRTISAESVFDSVPGTVEWPYSGYNLESFNRAVSLVSTVVDMAL